MIEIAAIDNDRMLLEGMAAWIAKVPDIRLTATASSVADFLSQAVSARIVLLDLNLEDFSDPVDNVASLVAAGFTVIVITVVPDLSYILATTEAGAAAYVAKTANLTVLSDAIRAVARGDSPLTTEHAFWLGRDDRPDRPELTPREHEVLVAYGRGMTVDAVGRQLGIAAGTVRTYLERAKQKYADVGRPIRHRGQYTERIREDALGRERLPGSGASPPPVG
ncbi:DNA-binding NarL/FixJ family response regulator [Allocatelliglobosispora scoriae]|uniref:DNA-binding NarL/FixJ family response regulator n=1 Tax=Allocatelliglobosispora scoriae TaxID=643052 RepID=A0A841BKW9_9ACTN|nr:response regulator transcription factor [Allocatelliglobosispora scoriae]MBB5868285.1 DNA-binding NarL/FixJ family response regulator [Allocatelliglobosispora scoriae]